MPGRLHLILCRKHVKRTHLQNYVGIQEEALPDGHVNKLNEHLCMWQSADGSKGLISLRPIPHGCMEYCLIMALSVVLLKLTLKQVDYTNALVQAPIKNKIERFHMFQ